MVSLCLISNLTDVPVLYTCTLASFPGPSDPFCRVGRGLGTRLLYCKTSYRATAMISFSLHFCTWQFKLIRSLHRDYFAFLHKLTWRQKKASGEISIHTGILEERALWLDNSTHLYLVLPILPCRSEFSISSMGDVTCVMSYLWYWVSMQSSGASITKGSLLVLADSPKGSLWGFHCSHETP